MDSNLRFFGDTLARATAEARAARADLYRGDQSLYAAPDEHRRREGLIDNHLGPGLGIVSPAANCDPLKAAIAPTLQQPSAEKTTRRNFSGHQAAGHRPASSSRHPSSPRVLTPR